jgi:hypothetical protein
MWISRSAPLDVTSCLPSPRNATPFTEAACCMAGNTGVPVEASDTMILPF